MGWSIGYDDAWKRDIGYGVPAYCDHPGCGAKIDRGIAYACGQEPYGGDHGCGLFFCGHHIFHDDKNQTFLCERCMDSEPPFEPTSEHPDWITWKLTDKSWQQWRDENPELVSVLRRMISPESKTDTGKNHAKT